MRVLIIEDEPLVAKNLEKLVRLLRPQAQIEGPLGSVEETLLWLEQQPTPDLILADIQLADGVSFDIFQSVNPLCPIVFTTAYDDYAIRAFKLNSIDYLLKPVDKEELQRAFEKFDRWQNNSATTFQTAQLQQLLSDLSHQTTKRYKTRFTAHYQRAVVAVPDTRVAYFTRDEVIWLVTTDNQRLITDFHSLDEVEELLDPAVFFRVNRTYLVRKEVLEGYRSHHTGRIELVLSVATKEDLTISKERAASFRAWFEE
ncbi:MAG: LytTR family DNA-binding domain-containing protein [Spirosomaceae bacterium]|jgi:DNA-binding LytR/AlgR family response regulator|nr:LytTR family DNA-binding domain-containing protein [Spirosomataceae bacterium]